MKRLVLAALLAILAGCSPQSRPVSDGEYDPSKLSYFKDPRTGLCFAVAGYSRSDSGGRISEGLSHSYVPCTTEVEALRREGKR